jgi:hypothetical protein
MGYELKASEPSIGAGLELTVRLQTSLLKL